jgi:hypothetical protein
MAPAPANDWRGGKTAADTNLSRKSSRWFATILAIALFCWLGWYVCMILFARSDETFLVTLPVVGSDRLMVPAIEFQDETLSDFQQLPDYLDSFELETAANVGGFTNRIRGWIEDKSPGAAPDKSILIAYVSAHGVVLDGEPFILCGDFSIYDDSGRCSLDELLDAVTALDAKTKLLVFDTGRIVSDARLGVLANDFTRLVAAAVAARGDDSLWVLCGTSPAERALVDYQSGRSLLGGSLVNGLRGYANLEAEGGNGDKKVTLKELYRFVLSRCYHRSSHPGGKQTPVLMHHKKGVVAPNAVDHLALVNLPRGWEQELQPPAAGEPASADGKEDGKEGENGDDEKGQGDGTEDEPAPETVAAADDEESAEPRRRRSDPAEAAAKEAVRRKARNSTPSAIENTRYQMESVRRLMDRSGVSEAIRTPGQGEGGEGDEAGGLTAAQENAIRVQEALDRLEVAWKLRDGLANVDNSAWSPVLFSPHLWRTADSWLIEYEHRLLAGNAYRHAELRRELEAMILRLEQLDLAVKGAATPSAGNSLVGDRLIRAWSNFQNDPPSQEGYAAVAIRAQATAVRRIQHAFFRAVDYVNWLDRAALISDGRPPEFSLIEALLSELVRFQEVLGSESVNRAADLVQIVDAVDKLIVGLDDRLASRANDAIRSIHQPVSQRRAEDLLAVALLPAETRMDLLWELELLKLTSASSPGELDEESALNVTPSLTLTSTQLDRLNEAIHLRIGLLQLANDSAASELERQLRSLAKKADSTRATELHNLASQLRDAYAELPQMINVDEDGLRVTAADRHRLRIVDARDVESQPRHRFDMLPAVPRLPANWVTETATLIIAQLDPMRLDLAEWRDLPVQVQSSGARGNDLIAVIQYDGDLIEIRNASSKKLVENGGAVNSLLRPDKGTTFHFQARARTTTASAFREAPLNLVVTDGGSLRRETSVAFVLPPPNDIELSVRREGVDYDQREISVDADLTRMRPFPNRSTIYEFALRNRSERSRTVTVELLAVPRPGNATWAPGRIFQFQELERQLFDPGSGRIRSNVAVVARLEEMELPEDPDKWVPIEFGKKKPAPPAEGDATTADPPPPSDPAAAPKVDITDGLALRVHDPNTDMQWLKWIEILPKTPASYLNVTSRYDVADEKIYLTVEPQSGRRLEEMLPPDIAEKPITVKMNIDAAARNVIATLTPEETKVELWAQVPPDGESRYFDVDVDGWPRAFGFLVECSRDDNTIGYPERPNVQGARIISVALDGDPTVYLTGPVPEDPPPPEEGKEPKQFKPLPRDGVARFRDRAGASRLIVEFHVDAPDNRFVRGIGDDQIVLWREVDDRRNELYFDRQMNASAAQLPNGWLAVDTSIADYSIRMASGGAKDATYRVVLDLNLNGQTVATNNVTVLRDGRKPTGEFITNPPANARVPAGQKIDVRLEITDMSGIDSLEWALDPEGRLEKPKKLSGARIIQAGEKARVAFSIDTAELKPGRWLLVGKATDKVGNVGEIESRAFQIVAPRPVAAPKLEITGVVLLQNTGKPLDGAKVELQQGGSAIKTTKTDGDGRFKFSDLEEGAYDIVAEGKRRANTYKAEVPGVEPTKPGGKRLEIKAFK